MEFTSSDFNMNSCAMPSFFIVGAPKCGTTALCEYLNAHPNICLSSPKEPMYFLEEWPELHIASTEKDYLSCFNLCQEKPNVVFGEGSALYLLSEKAIPNILKFNPDSKFIIMVRNPVDMAASLYAQNKFYGDEDAETFELALDMQEERSKGFNIPAKCRHPVLVQYELNCKLGALVNRAFLSIPEAQRLVIVFDDFVKDTGLVYRNVLNFLCLPDDGRQYFPRINERKRARWPWVNNFLAKPPSVLKIVALRLKNVLGLRSLGIHNLVVRLNAMKEGGGGVTPAIRRRLSEVFSSDIDLLGKLLCRDLERWKQ